MAVASGKAGSLTTGTATNLLFRSWTIDYNQEALETTNYDSSGAREYAVGLTGWSGSAEGFVNGATTAALPTAACTIDARDNTTGSGLKWTGSVIVTGMSFSPPVDGVSSCNITFQGTGALTIGAS